MRNLRNAHEQSVISLDGQAAEEDYLHPPGNFALTISEADLSCRGNDDIHFQGNYDYHAHAQVYTGGADPLGSQGYASAVRHPSSS
jgi:hypothetical protein